VDPFPDDLRFRYPAPVRNLLDQGEIFRIGIDVRSLKRHVPMLAPIGYEDIASAHLLADQARGLMAVIARVTVAIWLGVAPGLARSKLRRTPDRRLPPISAKGTDGARSGGSQCRHARD
jgi:hypothetical protein